ncbi:MAG: endolytic transglycosylase MltG, partial [bacterium]|nr:endolytic transglycosylase MltG [bacterium]
SQNFGIPENEFVQSAKEGHLFPDTYLIPKQATTENILSIFYNNFDKKYDDSLKTKARKLGLTEEEVVTLASLVEREARNESERKNVASILLKRLKNDWPLQVDATVQYIIGYQQKEKLWWKRNLTQDDLDVESPYNTYKNKGLPPTPICSPGLLSIQAVVEADPTTPYWFYLTDPSGKTHYSKTVEEHDAQVNQYLR